MAEGKSSGWAFLVTGLALGGLLVWWFVARRTGHGPEGRPGTPVSHCMNHQSQTTILHVQATCPGAVDHDPVALCAGDKVSWTKEPPEQSPGVNTFAVQFTVPSPTSTAPTPAPLQDPNGGKDKTTFGDNEVGFAKSVSHISGFPSDGYFDYTVSVNSGQACDPGIIIVR